MDPIFRRRMNSLMYLHFFLIPTYMESSQNATSQSCCAALSECKILISYWKRPREPLLHACFSLHDWQFSLSPYYNIRYEYYFTLCYLNGLNTLNYLVGTINCVFCS